MDEFSTTYVVNQYAMNPINMLYHRFLQIETILHTRTNWYDGYQKIRKPICIRLCYLCMFMSLYERLCHFMSVYVNTNGSFGFFKNQKVKPLITC